MQYGEVYTVTDPKRGVAVFTLCIVVTTAETWTSLAGFDPLLQCFSTTPPDPDAKLAYVDDRDAGCLMGCSGEIGGPMLAVQKATSASFEDTEHKAVMTRGSSAT